MPAPRTVLLTGAAGGLGTLMRGLLPAYGYELRLFDVAPVEGEPDAITADLGDEEALREAVRGVDAIIHLAGISLEASFDKILKANIQGTYHLYEAAREEGVRRIVFASSNHVIGYTPRPLPGDPLIPIDAPRRPDTFYGLSKSFGEDLAQLYWDRHGMETVSVRIGSCFPVPTSVRMLSVWMSPEDGARLFHAALTAEDVRHTVVHGSSDNTRLWWDLTTARSLGYEPRDDSEPYAAELLAEQGELDPDNPDHAHLGGHFCTNPPIWPR
ncbi:MULTISPECIES: NAD-dependent epimerase/dehydratase family protein [unclassified Streptomyces]|uniref:NAD-dependent epimerase/dehydratase family protein n=1 Tax=unclassified Streptomyces TaxID=2593676 RepID=UPI00225873F7|nr:MULTISPECIES: NAD(P)-dependent oxidoreductase [unclassified Streptomyces]WSP54417.1 NAD(P)-dependent oxidoreductase [Streptomyces sp. NBC_01241]WSU24908.1 NAD(P)-dependent oxidoreductase [Streptomyces sp. NBC_01108]MCX4785948.1 NAD(P)-dependent oxidoreductase [Streptomyces sp. NBC_01221]MCX4798196.1 NAD(P)-dependent oxidoreductase [Streptomyces sp. NBC_01242]WSJ39443.1 NAD(P)-dependent oxidoreductase [Streptomyces sp. NBC_01321]